jgi:hypothetical protein
MSIYQQGSKVKFYESSLNKYIVGTIVRKWEGTDRYRIKLDNPIPNQTPNVIISESRLVPFQTS